MSDTPQEPTLAERLRMYRQAAENASKASDEMEHAASFIPRKYRYPSPSGDAYLTGHDDATREAAARIKALEARVRELESQLATAEQQRDTAQEQVVDLLTPKVLASQPSPAAVGVVGKVIGYANVMPGSMLSMKVMPSKSEAEAQRILGDHVVALVDPDSIVPLQSRSAIAEWTGTTIRWGRGLEKAYTNPCGLYAGQLQPAREET